MKGDPYGIDGLDTLVHHLNELENSIDYSNHRELDGIEFGRWDWVGDGITKDYEIIRRPFNKQITEKQIGFTIHLSYLAKKSEIGYIPRPWYNKTDDGRITELVVPKEKMLLSPAPPFAMLKGSKIEPTGGPLNAERYKVYMKNGKYVVSNDSVDNSTKYIKDGKYVNLGGDYASKDPAAAKLLSEVGAPDGAPFPERRNGEFPVTSVYNAVHRHNKLFLNTLYRFVLDRIPFMIFDSPIDYYVLNNGKRVYSKAEYENTREAHYLKRAHGVLKHG